MSKDEVIAILVETFRRDGYDGASIATLSKATGLGKSSLYHYFPGGKVDMATQVLAAVQDWIERRMVATLTGGGTPRARLARDAFGEPRFHQQRTDCAHPGAEHS